MSIAEHFDPSDPGSVAIPTAALTHAGFRQWLLSDDFPRRTRATFVQDQILIDMSPEELHNHNRLKMVVSSVLQRMEDDADLGMFFGDGTLLTHEGAALSTEPDGLFVRWESFERGAIREIPRADRPDECVELVGTPDLVLEVVSQGSSKKDRVTLRQAYHAAGVPEYWLIDARRKEIDFQVLLHHPDEYRAAVAVDGWLESPTLGRSIRLERERNRRGRWHYSLHIRAAE